MDTKLTMEQRAIVLSEVESKMLKGIQRPTDIAKEVGCSVPSAIQYISTVKTKWQKDGAFDFNLAKGEMIEKLREIERGLWETFATADNSSAKVGAMKALLEVQKQYAFFNGITNIIESMS